MTRKIIIRILVGIFICFFAFIAIAILIKELNFKRKYIYINNPINYKLIGKVDSLVSMHAENGINGTYFRLSNDHKHFYRLLHKGTLYKKDGSPYANYELILKGDSIYKETGSVKVTIYRNGELDKKFYLKE